MGTAHLRFDVRHDWSAISLAGTSESDTIKWGKNGGNSLQDYGKVWQTGPVPSNGTFLVSAISARTYAVFEFDNQAYTSLVAAGTDQNIALAASRGSMVSNSTGGTTQVVPRTDIQVDEGGGKKLAVVPAGISLQELVNGLNALGIGPRDMITILQSIKAAGALQAEIQVM